MPAPSHRGLLAVVRRLAAESPPESDAHLVRRFVAGRDPDAFAALVRRHGPMVRAVCRRRLRSDADVDDAFQVTFMVLARDAGRVADPGAVAGWLHRVAHLSAIKLRGRLARRPGAPMPSAEPADPAAADPADAPAAAEVRRLIDDEVAALPDKLRAAVVLCGLEGLTNAEAARRLGCPTGTVDSRLSAARKRLRVRLARHGVAPAAAAAAGLEAERAVACPVGLADRTVHAAFDYLGGGSSADALASTANGVTPLMGTVNLKLIAAGVLSAAALVTTGVGLMTAPADDPPVVARVAPTPPAAKPPVPPGPAAHAPRDEAGLRAALADPFPLVLEGEVTFKDLLTVLHERCGVTARIDLAAFKRVRDGQDGDDPISFYDQPVRFPVTRGLTVGDALSEAVAQLPGRCAFKLRGSQAIIVPAYVPPVTPGHNAVLPGEAQPFITASQLTEQIVGEPVTVAIDDLPLTEALKELRKRTGANIVLDARCKDKAKGAVSGAFADVRLLTVLDVLSDQCDLKPVAMNNVYYITTAENAARRQREINRELFGDPTTVPPVPASPAGG